MDDLTRDALEGAHCWFDSDRVSRQPEVTAFKRRARLQQARWREERGFAIGSHWSGRPRVERPNGGRLQLEFAEQTGANFLSDRIRSSVRHRLARPEPHETIDRVRLWSDLLSSMPMCFNLFGELHDDPERLARAAGLFVEHDAAAEEVRFEWSPGRRDPRYLGDRTAFDAALVCSSPTRGRGVIGIETKYHEHAVAERPPDPDTRMPRYRDVTEASGIFKPGWEAAVVGTELQQLWRDHLLVLAMLQAADGWDWGRYVLVHPADNPSFSVAADRYRSLLKDHTTFAVRTIEELLEEHLLHPPDVEADFRGRYLWPT